jgi:hypothetical protein
MPDINETAFAAAMRALHWEHPKVLNDARAYIGGDGPRMSDYMGQRAIAAYLGALEVLKELSDA